MGKKICCTNRGCGSTNITPIDTKKKFSLGKSIVGNTVGGLVFGPVGAVVGAATGLHGKNGKTTFYCNSCGRTFTAKI